MAFSLSFLCCMQHYLLLQNRFKKEIAVLGRNHDEKEIGLVEVLRIQYDYMAAYLGFYTGESVFKVSRNIVNQYIAWPVITLRLLFLDMD